MRPTDLSERVFKYASLASLRRTYEKQRSKIAAKLGNPQLLKISFHTFRHWKATITYYQTKDILFVMQMLGHKNIKNTLKYTQLLNPDENTEEYVSRVATNAEEARKLVEAGFEYVCTTPENIMLFRKRK